MLQNARIFLALPIIQNHCVTDPIFERRASDVLHLRAATPNEFQRSIRVAQRAISAAP